MKYLNYSITPMTEYDRVPVMGIFNHYIEHSFAAYRETRLNNKAFDVFLQSAKGYPTGIVRDEDGTVLGFGLLRAHRPIVEFNHTAEITYFLHHDHLGLGLGKKLLQQLEKEGRENGVTTLLAHISSRNRKSLEFHARNGFQQCGCFKSVGRKNGKYFDVIWMQKVISAQQTDNMLIATE